MNMKSLFILSDNKIFNRVFFSVKYFLTFMFFYC